MVVAGERDRLEDLRLVEVPGESAPRCVGDRATIHEIVSAAAPERKRPSGRSGQPSQTNVRWIMQVNAMAATGSVAG